MSEESDLLIALGIDSVESLEILMLLRRSPEAFWGAAAITHQLGVTRELADRKLEMMLRSGTVVRGSETGAFRFAPRDQRLGVKADRLAELYSEHRASVINAVYTSHLETLRAFSDAFKLKKEP